VTDYNGLCYNDVSILSQFQLVLCSLSGRHILDLNKQREMLNSVFYSQWRKYVSKKERLRCPKMATVTAQALQKLL